MLEVLVLLPTIINPHILNWVCWNRQDYFKKSLSFIVEALQTSEAHFSAGESCAICFAFIAIFAKFIELSFWHHWVEVCLEVSGDDQMYSCSLLTSC